MAAKSGRTPISPVAQPIITTVIRRAGRRPMRSPTAPKITAPTGRATKPTPKVAKAAIVAAAGLSVLKYSRLKTRAEAVPNRK
jgi:hypothetical protein